MPQNKGRAIVSKHDMDLLYKMYRYRALSTDQVAKLGGYGAWYVYKKVAALRNKELIRSEPIRGNFIIGQSRQGSYHRIRDKGLTLLKDNGYDVKHYAHDIKVSEHHLVYLLATNDIVIDLKEYGWRFKDSRYTKSKYNLNRSSLLHGTLEGPTKDEIHAFYVLMKDVNNKTVIRLKQEIERNPFDNILVTTRGMPSFQSVIKKFTERNNRLITGGNIRVLPFGFAKEYLKIIDDKQRYKELLHTLGVLGKREVMSKRTFKYTVNYQGEEMYFINLLDNDLMQIEELKRYRKEDYERYGKKVLVLTSSAEFHHEIHKKMLQGMKHVKYFVVDPREIVHGINNLTSHNENSLEKGDST